jgi:peptide/nickel transport system substrate-binding protein
LEKRRKATRGNRRRISALGVVTYAALSSLAGCESPGIRDNSDSEPGGTAVVGVPSPASTLLPPLAATALDFEVGGLLYPGLNVGVWEDSRLHFEQGHPDGLATSWSLEGSRLTYRLDPSRTWSDGAPVEARDVVFTFELLSDSSLALPLSSTIERIDSVTAPDASTVVFHFDAPYPGMLFDTGVGILPEHVFGQVSRDRFAGGIPLPDGTVVSDLPVAGPFRLVEWIPEDRITLARNNAARSPAVLDRLVIRVIPDEGTRAAELRAGSIQAAALNSYRMAKQLAEVGLALLRVPQRGFDYIGLNPAGHPAFADPNVRQALSLAVDRSAMIGALDMTGFAEPAWGPYGSLFADLRAPAPQEPLYDLERARALLLEAGFDDFNALEFELAVPAGNGRREDAAQIVQAQLAEVGVSVSIRPQEFNSLLGRMIEGDYEAALMGWQVALDPDISPFWSDPAAPLNVVDFADARVTSAISSALAQTDRAAAAPYWREAAEGVAAAYPYVFLWYIDLPFAAHPSLLDVSVDVTGWASGARRWRVRQSSNEDAGRP